VGIVLAHEVDGSLCNWASIAPEFADKGPGRELLIVSGSEHGTALYGGPAAEQVRDAVDRLLERTAPTTMARQAAERMRPPPGVSRGYGR
jgi:hypothetical protein